MALNAVAVLLSSTDKQFTIMLVFLANFGFPLFGIERWCLWTMYSLAQTQCNRKSVEPLLSSIRTHTHNDTRVLKSEKITGCKKVSFRFVSFHFFLIFNSVFLSTFDLIVRRHLFLSNDNNKENYRPNTKVLIISKSSIEFSSLLPPSFNFIY